MAPYVDLTGIDPTGLLLGPLGAHPRGWRVNGTADAADRYPALLAELVDDMDDRIAHLPPRCDRMPITAATPLRFVVLEELAGISRMTGYRQSGAHSETQRHIARLASEGRKAGYRLLVISQRLGADVLATDVRDQLLARFTFGTRDLATLRMLSPDATPEDLGPLALSPAGVALAELPGMPLTRVRGPWAGGYGTYCDLVAAA
jgi:S-DNA-T family DNA segregation ATPase FtsK/SpoIIIE